ncbi:hypothetical protein FQZ97_898650 [compost metagenome]
MAAMRRRALWSWNGMPKADSALPMVSSPESTCIGANEPPLGVPSISKREPARSSHRCHTSGRSSCTVRATRPPMECVSRHTGWPLVARAARAWSIASARRTASSSMGRRQSNENSMTSWVADRKVARSSYTLPMAPSGSTRPPASG